MEIPKWEEFVKAYSAQYKSPSGFYRWSRIAKTICTHAGLARKSLLLDQTNNRPMGEALKSAANNEYFVAGCYAALSSVTKQTPLRFISANMCKAFVATKVPEFSEIPPAALPSVLLSLPAGAVPCVRSNAFVTAIGCEFTPEADTSLEGPYARLFFIVTDGTIWNFNAHWSERENQLENKKSIKENADLGSSIHDANRVFNDVRAIALHSRLVMAYKPDLVTTDPLPSAPSGVGFGARRSGTGLRSVIWIGKNYVPRRERSQRDGATGLSVATHWRSGHWHTVLHGPQRDQRRLQWYEPVLVNADPAARGR